MKCLSVSQPFADLIARGRKKIELRSWNTSFRGEFLVHAPLKVRSRDAARLRINGEFVTGAVIGMAEIFDVKRYKSKSECKSDYALHFASKEFHGKRYGFLLRGAKMFRVPIPCKGRLGFFEQSLPDASMGEAEIISEIIDEEYRYQWIGHH